MSFKNYQTLIKVFIKYFLFLKNVIYLNKLIYLLNINYSRYYNIKIKYKYIGVYICIK